MTLKEFIDSLTPEQKTYFTNYIAKREDQLYEHGRQDGIRAGLIRARNAINERYNLL